MLITLWTLFTQKIICIFIRMLRKLNMEDAAVTSAASSIRNRRDDTESWSWSWSWRSNSMTLRGQAGAQKWRALALLLNPSSPFPSFLTKFMYVISFPQDSQVASQGCNFLSVIPRKPSSASPEEEHAGKINCQELPHPHAQVYQRCPTRPCRARADSLASTCSTDGCDGEQVKNLWLNIGYPITLGSA